MSGARRYGPEDVTPADRRRILAALTPAWQTGEAMAAATHMDLRLLQVTMRVLALDGEPVVSGGAGYRVSTDPKAVAKAGGELVRRGLEIIKRGKALVETARRLRGGPVQQSLF